MANSHNTLIIKYVDTPARLIKHRKGTKRLLTCKFSHVKFV